MNRHLTREEINGRMGRLRLYISFMRLTEKSQSGTDEARERGRVHLQYQLNNADAGMTIFAGPLNFDRRDEYLRRREAGLEKGPPIDAFGWWIATLPSIEEAQALADSEPFEQVGWRNHTFCTWSLNEGTVMPLARQLIESGPKKDFKPKEMTREEIDSRMGGVPLYVSFMWPTEKFQTEGDYAQEKMREHLQFQLDNEDLGITIGAGPINYDRREEVLKRREAGLEKGPPIDAIGMFIFAAPSYEAAAKLADSEPFQKIGWREHTLVSFRLNEGQAVPLARQMVAEQAAKGWPRYKDL